MDGVVSEPWRERLLTYLNALESSVFEVKQILEQAKVDTARVDQTQLKLLMDQLQEALARFEIFVAKRQELLDADDAPVGQASGKVATTLSEMLRQTGSIQDAELADHCDGVSAQIEQTHHHALSLFVCQYHLADFTSDVVRSLAGIKPPSTYSQGVEQSTDVNGSGGLFNEAA